MTTRDEDNAVRFRPDDDGGHVESHFLKATSPDAERAVWVKHTIFSARGAPDRALSETWAIAFERGRPPVGAKTTAPVATARFSERPFRVQAQTQSIENGRAQGSVESGGHRVAWDLRYGDGPEPFHPFPLEGMYKARFPKSKTLTPYPDTRMDGSFEVDGTRVDVAGWRGMQGHNWGRSHAHAYAWAHCNAFDDAPGTWFEGLSGRVAVGPIVTPWLTVAAISVDGHVYRFDRARAMLSRSISVGWYRWSFALEDGRGNTLEAETSARREDLAGLRYPNPAGAETACLNSKLATGRLTLRRPGSAVRTFRTRALALELGTLERTHGVPLIL